MLSWKIPGEVVSWPQQKKTIVAATATMGVDTLTSKKQRQASKQHRFPKDSFVSRLCLENITHYGRVCVGVWGVGIFSVNPSWRRPHKSEYLDWAKLGERHPQASLGPHSLCG